MEIFLDHILTKGYGVNVSKNQLEQSLSSQHDQIDIEDFITFCVQNGLLLNHGASTYAFFVPGRDVSALMNCFLSGREEVVSLIRRLKFKEILLKDLRKKKLKNSFLGAELHVRDLIGQDELESVSTSSGPLIKLVTVD
eukprot:TRINITY_DN7885_c0_g1_i1.p1 TRINITY_DN7885_c0_g1~~TRINITY_DN7885_c0_g1_i1.p1  ORF type:complete len:139 (+),score=23.71 TRINITY_DN7885_c0_g1_i1:454-870(+)